MIENLTVENYRSFRRYSMSGYSTALEPRGRVLHKQSIGAHIHQCAAALGQQRLRLVG